ncbi:MAG: epoxyqueuosine reductase QueH [Elusimicrobia bacterium]|nr:epoxyqueuosine reductase QueH [Elusimicrobiota bacterium]
MFDKILLHHCCAVCTPKVLESFKKEFKEVIGFWFNPNIYPVDERKKRQEALKVFSEEKKHRLMEKNDYPEDLWSKSIENNSGEPERCRICYSIRMKITAQTAKKMNIRHFSTTLLSSPHQKHDLIKAAGIQAAAEEGLDFVYRDFRPEFYEGKNEIWNKKLYMQKYCGCLYSINEKK